MLEVKAQPSVQVHITLSGRSAELLSAAAAERGVTVTEWLQMTLERLLGASEEEGVAIEEWQTLGLVAFEAGWDNSEDAVYDNWRQAYGVPAR